MHVSSDSTRGSGRLSVFYEQDLLSDDDVVTDIESKMQNLSLPNAAVDRNNNNNNSSSSSNINESINSSEFNNETTPPVIMRRHKSTGHFHSRSRERNFVYAASGAVVDGARSVARTFKRISLIESSSSSNIREREAQETLNAQDGVVQLKANAKHKQQYNSTPSLPQSYSTLGASLQPSDSVHSLGSSPSQSPRSSQNKGKGGGSTAGKNSNTAKQHDQQNSVVAAISSTSAAAAGGGGGGGVHHHNGATSQGATPPEGKEKEKKRKEVSSSRVKKFHRHFSQVSKDEKLINYFSCALVGDIPLQGYLYITKEHFAFYSNVFGYVTKVVIPTSSVTKISKEKTAKIIPNAVGVATADERHVFGSFISREAAFRLMSTVCIQLATGNEILPKPLPVDVELPEEYIIDDDSSCSISGNESPPHLRSAIAAAVAAGGVSDPETMIRQRSIGDRHTDLQGTSNLAMENEVASLAHAQVTIRSSAPPVVHYEEPSEQLLLGSNSSAGSHPTATLYTNCVSTSSAASSSGPTSSSSSPITVVGLGLGGGLPPPTVATRTAPPPPIFANRSKLSSMGSRLRLRLPTITELHVLYLGVLLAIMLALFSVFLLYRILDIEAKTRLYNTPIDFNMHSGNDEDLFAEALRWQKELQDKSTAEAQHILTKNLEQISKVRRSLETLSMLIRDRRTGFAETETEMQTEMGVDGAGELEPELLPIVHVASSSSDYSD